MNELPSQENQVPVDVPGSSGFPGIGKLRIFLHQGRFVKRCCRARHGQLDGLVTTAKGQVDGDGDGHQGQQGQSQHVAPQRCSLWVRGLPT